MRRIAGLVWAKPCPWPSCIPRRARLRGARAAGIRYEKAVAKAIPGAKRGPWFEFFDANGHGYCQPDIVVDGHGRVLVVECKLTDIELAQAQLDYLYLPVLREVYRRPVVGLIVVRHLTKVSDRASIHTSLPAALRAGDSRLVHWLGGTPLA